MSRTMISLASAAVGLAIVGSAEAAIYAYEGFDGSPSGFSAAFPAGTGGDRGTDTAASLSYGGLVTSGVARQGGQVLTAKGILTTPVTSGTVWMSWLYKTSAPAAQWNRLVTFIGNDTNNSGERYNLGYTDDGFKVRGVFGFGARPTAAWTTSQADNTTYMLVAKYEFGAAGTEDGIITLWVNPDTSSLGSGAAPTGGNQIIATGISDDGMRFDGFGLHGSQSPQAQFDEVRIGDSWAAVSPVPEPGAIAMMAGFAAVILRRRRR